MTLARVQATGSGVQTAAAGTVATSAFGSNVAIGDAVVVFASSHDSSGNTNGVTSVTDSSGNSYTQVPGVLTRQTQHILDCWICPSNAFLAKLVITVHFTNSTGANCAIAVELNGPISLDQLHVASNANSTAPNSGATPATTYANDFAFGVVANAKNALPTSPTFSTALGSTTTETLADNTLAGQLEGLSVTDGPLVSSGVAETFSATQVTSAWICACVIFSQEKLAVTATAAETGSGTGTVTQGATATGTAAENASGTGTVTASAALTGTGASGASGVATVTAKQALTGTGAETGSGTGTPSENATDNVSGTGATAGSGVGTITQSVVGSGTIYAFSRLGIGALYQPLAGMSPPIPVVTGAPVNPRGTTQPYWDPIAGGAYGNCRFINRTDLVYAKQTTYTVTNRYAQASDVGKLIADHRALPVGTVVVGASAGVSWTLSQMPILEGIFSFTLQGGGSMLSAAAPGNPDTTGQTGAVIVTDYSSTANFTSLDIGATIGWITVGKTTPFDGGSMAASAVITGIISSTQVYATVNVPTSGSNTHAGCSVTSGLATVNDPNIGSTDAGLSLVDPTGTYIPAGSVVSYSRADSGCTTNDPTIVLDSSAQQSDLNATVSDGNVLIPPGTTIIAINVAGNGNVVGFTMSNPARVITSPAFSGSVSGYTLTVGGLRNDTNCTVFDGTLVLDGIILAEDNGKPVSSNKLPSGTIVTNVIEGVSFNTSKQATGATGNATMTVNQIVAGSSFTAAQPVAAGAVDALANGSGLTLIVGGAPTSANEYNSQFAFIYKDDGAILQAGIDSVPGGIIDAESAYRNGRTGCYAVGPANLKTGIGKSGLLIQGSQTVYGGSRDHTRFVAIGDNGTIWIDDWNAGTSLYGSDYNVLQGCSFDAQTISSYQCSHQVHGNYNLMQGCRVLGGSGTVASWRATPPTKWAPPHTADNNHALYYGNRMIDVLQSDRIKDASIDQDFQTDYIQDRVFLVGSRTAPFQAGGARGPATQVQLQNAADETWAEGVISNGGFWPGRWGPQDSSSLNFVAANAVNLLVKNMNLYGQAQRADGSRTNCPTMGWMSGGGSFGNQAVCMRNVRNYGVADGRQLLLAECVTFLADNCDLGLGLTLFQPKRTLVDVVFRNCTLQVGIDVRNGVDVCTSGSPALFLNCTMPVPQVLTGDLHSIRAQSTTTNPGNTAYFTVDGATWTNTGQSGGTLTEYATGTHGWVYSLVGGGAGGVSSMTAGAALVSQALTVVAASAGASSSLVAQQLALGGVALGKSGATASPGLGTGWTGIGASASASLSALTQRASVSGVGAERSTGTSVLGQILAMSALAGDVSTGLAIVVRLLHLTTFRRGSVVTQTRPGVIVDTRVGAASSANREGSISG